MIGEKIKQFRKAKGLSQEELAIQLGVVRQTVSKWEKGLSVPDAKLLLRLAEVLGVSVPLLLGSEGQEESLAQQLAQLNAQLAEAVQREKQVRLANQKRGMILALVFASILSLQLVRNEVVSLLLFVGCALAALVIYYRNLELLTAVTNQDAELRPLRLTTVFGVTAVIIIVAVALLHQSGIISLTEEAAMTFLVIIIVAFILFTGYIAPKLPFNRHTGLRLPWTVMDEETWNMAHRILSAISLPAALLYPAAVCIFPDFLTVTMTAVLLYIGIPGVLSLIFFWRKMHG